MENVASPETATMKKKRNRSQKRPKSKLVNKPEQTAKENNAQAANPGQENNRISLVPDVSVVERQKAATNHSVTCKGEIVDVTPVSRNPSGNRRRKRKPKPAREAKDIETVLDSLTVEEIFPVGQIYSQAVSQALPVELPYPVRKVVVQENLPVTETTLVDCTKYAGIVEIDYRQLFPIFEGPVVQNISLDEIFPGLDVYSFDGIKTPLGKLTTSEQSSKETVTERQTFPISLPLKEGLLHITAEDIFPNNLLIGLTTDSEIFERVISRIDCSAQQSENSTKMSARPEDSKSEKTREEILAEREAKKAVKLAAKNKKKEKTNVPQPQSVGEGKSQHVEAMLCYKAESPAGLSKSGTDGSICEKLNNLHISDGPGRADKTSTQSTTTCSIMTKELSKAERKAEFEAKNPTLCKKGPQGVKPTLSKAERRAIQEAQRAAKTEAQQAKKRDGTTTKDVANKTLPPKSAGDGAKTTGVNQSVRKSVPLGVVGTGGPPRKHIVNLFNHLHKPKFAAAEIVNSPTLHPAVTKLGIQYAEGAVVGSKARCFALLKTLNQLIHDYETPPEKEFGRSFEETLNTLAAYLQRCRPFSVSMTNALRHVKMCTRQLDGGKVSDSEQKETLLESIQSYIRDHIEKAEEAICISVQEKIYDGDVILTYGCSSLIKHILEEANRRSKNFRVIIVSARPREQENAMLEHLVQQGVKCTCVLINAVSYVMAEVTKVLLGAHALLANGSVMSRVGTAQVALVAKSHNVPVLVCCETHKFTERVQTDAFVYNEIGNPNDLVLMPWTGDLGETKPMLDGWETLTSLTILNLHYDVTPPELVTAVVTEVAILPCTSVPVILRIKPSDVTTF